VLTPDGEGFSLALARGGHAAPLIMRANGTAGHVSVPGGPLIGVWDDAAFTAITIRLSAGDTLLLFTDGLTDARTRVAGDSGRYGEEALRAFVTDLAPTTAAGAISAMTTLLEDLAGGLDDDTAILALGVPPAST
jgi:phosphoserine phosphatase RsbU/P